MSTENEPRVDLVANEAPHAQVTVASLYSGWISAFMVSFTLRK
jgi:hypothetical protein